MPLSRIRTVMERDGVTPLSLCNPFVLAPFLYRHKYIHFFAIGISGVAVNVGLTGFFAEFVFGRERYFDAYLIGLGANLLYNFTLHTVITFRTTRDHGRRFILFAAYSIAMTAFQAWVVKMLTPIIGIDYYLFVIAGVIFVFSTVTFFVFKLSIFKKVDIHEEPAS